MQTGGDQPSFWDAVRSWADSAGLLLPPEETGDPDSTDDGTRPPPRPTVPQAVCDSCPICQAAATIDQVNPQIITDLTEVARSLMAGLSSAMSSASDQRQQRVADPEAVQGSEPDEDGDDS